MAVADNTGARVVYCIKVLGGFDGRRSVSRGARPQLGDVIICSVKKAQPGGDVKQGDIVRCVVCGPPPACGVRTAAMSSSTITPAVIIDANNNPRGTRIFGAVARELREKGLHEDRLPGHGGRYSVAMHIKKGDLVVVIAGDERGQDRRGVAGQRRGGQSPHPGPSTGLPAPEAVPPESQGRAHSEGDMPMSISNVLPLDPKTISRPAWASARRKTVRKVRFARKSGSCWERLRKRSRFRHAATAQGKVQKRRCPA